MKNYNKLGFTLIELLAVIVILAIILAVAVPGISGIVASSRKNAFQDDAKMILEAIDYQKLKDDTFDPTTINKTTVSSVLKLSPDNYQSVITTIVDDKVKVVIIGQNKWAGLVAYGYYDDMSVVNTADYDVTPPVITLLGSNPISIDLSSTYTDAGATATDNMDGDVTNNIVITGTVNPNVVGTYTITYTVSDAVNNEASLIRTVNVIDNIIPTIAFGTNGNSTYAKTRITTVTVSDNAAVNASSLKYLWNTSTATPAEGVFTTSFTNDEAINSPAGVTGGYYLWVLAKDMQGNMAISRTDVFNLDNTNPVITLVGSSSIGIYVNNSYTDAGATATDNIDGTITSSISSTSTVNTSVLGSYTVTYDVSDSSGNAATTVTRTVDVITDYVASEGVNRPKLATGMTAMKWNGSAWVTVTSPDTDTTWYDYAGKQWANAQTADGSMWVWIPRYAYQIATNYHTSTAGTINIKFLKETTNTASDNSAVDTVPTYAGSSQTNYIEHPAFTFGTTELTGMWVAKFEMSGTTASVDSKPGVASLRSVTVGNIFTAARNMETNNKYGWGLASGLNADGTFTTNTNNVDTHMMKNIEWGAVAYLSQSTFGKNAEITINGSSSWYTGGGSGTSYTTNGGKSTTGNIYGIYDISGGAYEYVMGNCNNTAGSSGLTPSSINDKYIDRYTAYGATKYGDALYETSTGTSGTTSWYGDQSYWGNSSEPWFFRGGIWSGGTSAGAFYFFTNNGAVYNTISWRSVVLVGEGL